MKKISRIFILLLAAAMTLIFAWRNPSAKTPPKRPEPAATSGPTPAAESVSSDAGQPPAPVAEPPAPVKPHTEESRASSRRDLANPLVTSSFQEATKSSVAGSDSPIAADLDKINLMFRDYRTLMGENPVGTNAEIMKAVMGGNPKSAMLGPPEGQSVNGIGELVDKWGNPYFFHQLTRDLMEIRSAGPDGRLWNEDDIIGK